MTAQQLKNAILQEAIQGRLVPQDPNDEPASILLKRIRAEKLQLVKEGKLKKKDLEEKPISEDEKPFEIPESWEWVRLKSLASVLGDGIHGTPEYDITGSYYFINGNNLSNNKIVIKADTKKVNEKEYQAYKKELNDKTILVSINGTIGNVGHYNGEPVILGKSACYYNLLDIRLKSYITTLMYTDYFLKYAVENATGSTIKNVSLAVMNDFLVPLPPLAEQKRIVAKIEELLPKVEEYGKAQEKLNKLNEELPEKLKKSVLQEAIEGRLVPQDPNDEPASALLAKIREEKKRLVKEGKLKKKDLEEKPISEDEILFEIPESWEWVRLKTVVFNHGQKHPDDTFSYIDIGSIDNKNQKLNEEEQIIEASKAPSRARRIVKLNDIVYSTVRPYLHNMAIINREFSAEPIASTGFAIFSCFRGLFNKYLFYYLMSPNFDDYANDGDNAKGVAYPAINDDKLYKALVPLPPLAEQKRIVAKIEQLLGEINKLNT